MSEQNVNVRWTKKRVEKRWFLYRANNDMRGMSMLSVLRQDTTVRPRREE
jgi:hypothetical protein